MKLIKLVSDSDSLTEATFNNTLAYPLTIKPFSQVALKNLSLQFNNPKFDVNNSNNTFRYKVSDGSLAKNIVLKNGEYTLGQMIEEIQIKMNNCLDSDNLGAGGFDAYLDWTIDSQENLRSNGEENLLFGYSRKGENLAITQGEAKSNNITFGTPKITKTTNSNLYDGKVQCKTLIANGGFQISITISNQDSTPITTSDWIWGVGDGSSVYDLSTKLEILPFMFCCMSNNAGKYTYKKGVSMIDTTETITTGDILTIYKLDGKIKYKIVRGGSTIGDYEGDVINDVIPRLGVNQLTYNLFIGNDSGKIAFRSLQEITKPTVVSNNGEYSVLTASEIPSIYYDSNLTGTSATKITFYFPTFGVKRLLGFSQDEKSNPSSVSGQFKGDLALQTQFLNNDLEVEIIELPINNYTHTYKQLRPVIMTIGGAEVKSNIVSYNVSFFELSFAETANFMWIDLDNAQDLRLASLTVRITSNGQVLEMNGRATATLLIKELKQGD